MAKPQPEKYKLSLYDVARAVEENRVALNLQPIVRSRETRFVMMYEGLIRIFDQEGDIRIAGEFMDIVEGSEVGNFIDQCALELAIMRLQIDPSLRLSINMSLRTLWDEDWMFLLEGAAKRNRNVTERLVVEFTETSVMSAPEQALEFMKYCRQYGVAFAVDDFGAGYTVLGHLRDFRFDIMKIDGSICQDLGENLDNQIIIKAVLSVAKHFEMTTIAEFIDNPAAAEKCKEFGVDAQQGFLYGQGEIYNPNYPDFVRRANSG